MKTRRIAAAVLVAFLSSSVTLPAAAQGEDAVTVQARARFKEGVDFFDKGSYENARLAFLQAYALKKHPAVLLNLAQSSAKSGHTLEAAQYFKQFQKEATAATPEQKAAAEAGLAEVRQKLGRIEVVAPAGTDISLDDSRVGSTPFPEPLDVDVGPHTLKSSTETVKVVATAGQKVQAKFGSAAAPPPPVAVPVPPPTTEPPKPEPKPDTPPETTEPPNKDYGHDKPGLFSPPETMVPVYLGLGLVVVGVGTAIGFAVAKSSAQDAADSVAADIRRAATQRGVSSQGICSSTNTQIQRDFANACATLRDNNDKVDTNALVANIGVGVAVVGAVTALGWHMFGPKRESRSGSTMIVPRAGLGSGGLDLVGTF